MAEQNTVDRDQILEHLVTDCGISRREAELRLLDDDLWILIPDQRVGLEGEEAIRQWTYAVGFADWLGDDNPALNDAAQSLVWDMKARAEEALRRAKKRAEEVQQSG